MKQNFRPIVDEVTKSTRISFDELDCVIESFGTGVADSVLTVVEQADLMAPEYLDYFFDWLQTTAHSIVGPCVKETFWPPPCSDSTRIG